MGGGGHLTLFKALTSGAFDRLNWQHSGEFDQNFSKKSNARGFARGNGWAVLELTGTLILLHKLETLLLGGIGHPSNFVTECFMLTSK